MRNYISLAIGLMIFFRNAFLIMTNQSNVPVYLGFIVALLLIAVGCFNLISENRN